MARGSRRWRRREVRLLGAIIAGGRSRRFGSDKALAIVDGRPMLAQVVDALRPQVERIVICGRDWPGLERLDDRPGPDMGPLGGLNAALHFGAAQGFDAVLSVPVDVIPLPGDLIARLGGTGPAVFERQHLIGLWPTRFAPLLAEHVDGGGRSLLGWIGLSEGLRCAEPVGLVNVNRPCDVS